MKKKILWAIVLIPIALALIVAFATAPFGRKYVIEHAPEFIGRKIDIEKFRLNILTGNVSLSDLTIYEQNGDSVFATVDDIDIDLSLADLIHGKFRIEDLDIDHPKLNVVQRGSKFNFDDIVAILSEGESSEYTIDDFSLDDGEINYLDLTEPSVPFSCHLHDFDVDIKNFNTADHNHIVVEGSIGKHGDVEAVYDGMISDQNNMSLTLKIEDLDLTQLSPLFVQMFGREVTDGELELQTEITSVNGSINGNNHLVISDPEVEKVKNLSFTPEYKKLPLKTALYVLTDKHGKCEMDIKVSGSMSDPKFTYKRALMRAFGKSLVKIVTSPFNHINADDE